MKIIFQKNKKRLFVRRGSALVMAILITMLLFLIGMGFISMMLTDKASVARIDDQAILDNAVDAVVDDIKQVLADDLFQGGRFLYGNAAYDYPDGNNRWLASLEPELVGDTNGDGFYNNADDVDGDGQLDYYWPQITDLWGKFSNQSMPKLAHYYDPLPQWRTDIDSNPSNYRHLAWDYALNPLADWNIVDGYSRAVCRIIPQDEPIRDIILNCMDDAPWWIAQAPYPVIYNGNTLFNNLTGPPRSLPLAGNIPAWDFSLPMPVDGPLPSLFVSDGLTRADADGDGVADSRWVRLFRIDHNGPWAHAIYAAVRIIDNGGMININTAHEANDGRLTSVNGWTTSAGNLLSDINLVYHAFNKGDPPWSLHDLRCGGNGAGSGDPDFIRYHKYVSMSILNPDPNPDDLLPMELPYFPNPYDITDELELRNRFFLTSPVSMRSGRAWQKTLDPQADPGRSVPFGAYGTDTILNRFNKANSLYAPNASNTRHFVTTYNFDRTACPWVALAGRYLDPSMYDPVMGRFLEVWPRKMGIALPNGGIGPNSGFATPNLKNMYIDQLAGAIYRGLNELEPNDIDNRFSDTYTREKLAWQYALNIVDYQDADGKPTYRHVELRPPSRPIVDFFGVENADDIKRDTLYVTALAFENDSTQGNVYALELFNPTEDDIDLDTTDLRIHVERAVNTDPNIYIESLNTELTSAGISTTITAKSTLVIASISKNLLEGAYLAANFNNAAEVLEVPGLEFKEDDQIVLYKNDYPIAGIDMPVDCFNVPTDMLEWSATPDQYKSMSRSKEIGDGSGGATKTYIFLSHPDSWVLNPDKLGDVVADSDITSIDMQSKTTNQLLKSVSEIENVFALGYSHNHTTGVSYALTNELGMVYEADTADGEKNPQIAGSELRSWGRINLRNKLYWPLLDFLTFFDASFDGMDNDGDGLVDENIVDPGTGFPINQELNVPGRININTAPWYVIKQLPWVVDGTASMLAVPAVDPDSLAQAIVGFRDKKNLELLPIYNDLLLPNPVVVGLQPDYSVGRGIATTGAANPNISETPGFRHIGQLLQIVVPNPAAANTEFDIRKKMVDGADLILPPDFSTPDSIEDDFEERDLIFNRISNLVTLRSDVFTAYILVRIGRDGPQKRMIAIFDRSNVFTPTDAPKLVALHPVPDPR